MRISQHMGIVWLIGFVFTLVAMFILSRDVLYIGAMGFGLYLLLLAIVKQNDIEQL